MKRNKITCAGITVAIGALLLIGCEKGTTAADVGEKTGVQIGLVNLIPSNAWFKNLPNQLAPGMIFVNWQF